jgi:cytochrome b561
MALWSGWLAAIAIVLAGAIPLGTRLRLGKRGAPTSKPIRTHVVLGLVTSALAFGHTILVIPALGSPAATGAGPLAIAPAGLAFFLLVAHAGLGLQLRDEKLKTRAKTRRSHATTAVAILLAVGIHILTLEQARR